MTKFLKVIESLFGDKYNFVFKIGNFENIVYYY